MPLSRILLILLQLAAFFSYAMSHDAVKSRSLKFRAANDPYHALLEFETNNGIKKRFRFGTARGPQWIALPGLQRPENKFVFAQRIASRNRAEWKVEALGLPDFEPNQPLPTKLKWISTKKLRFEIEEYIRTCIHMEKCPIEIRAVQLDASGKPEDGPNQLVLYLTKNSRSSAPRETMHSSKPDTLPHLGAPKRTDSASAALMHRTRAQRSQSTAPSETKGSKSKSKPDGKVRGGKPYHGIVISNSYARNDYYNAYEQELQDAYDTNAVKDELDDVLQEAFLIGYEKGLRTATEP
mmetsp:Transcript_42031/g.69222  ORF Transcript_42031/g.69222 Transcript_42031/m.69222 type:complete len:295 (+) Transcript_42031:1938-2822(+)